MTRDTKVIHIYYNGENHYDTITNVRKFRGDGQDALYCIYYCEFWDQGYNNPGLHHCPYGCNSDMKCELEEQHICSKCNRSIVRLVLLILKLFDQVRKKIYLSVNV